MHARRFSSSKHSTQGFVGDELSPWLRTAFFVEDDFEFFISSPIETDSIAFISFVLDSDDAVISTSLPSNEFVDDDPEPGCSCTRDSKISFM
jgi:hypothetical protein